MKPSRLTPLLVLAVVAATTAAIYWLGLKGPFILDDGYALDPVRSWSHGETSWQDAVFGSASLLFSRPIPMASFLLTTWLGGLGSFSFKLGNLVVHLLCGLLVWRIGRHAFALDRQLGPLAGPLALLLTALWLLHPLHVSTVLYAVQRMAQLSTLFTLAAVLVYLNSRHALNVGSTRKAWATMFVAFPLMVVAGLLSKQNAAVAPLLCLILELAYFNDWRSRRGPLTTFYGIFLAIPGAVAVAAFALYHRTLLAAFEDWDFTLGQRLLTQPRVLMDYVGMLLFPRGPRMGLYTDDFAVSTSLSSPASTWMAIAAIIVISALAIAVRKRAPSLFAGWFFFLGAHVVESTFLPIEMYYEHRNYLPAVGLLLALIGCAALVPSTLRLNVLTPRQLGLGAGIGFAMVLAVATMGRVLVWQSTEGILVQGLRFHPDSLRANFDAADHAAARGDYQTHNELMHRLIAGGDARSRQMARYELVAANCRTGRSGNRALLEAALAEHSPRITVMDSYGFMRLSSAARASSCGDLDLLAVGRYMARIVDAAVAQPESARPKWMARYMLGQMYGAGGYWDQAIPQLEIAWQGSHDKKVGVFLARAYANTGRFDEASRMLALMEARIPARDWLGRSALSAVRTLINERRSAAAGALPGSA